MGFFGKKKHVIVYPDLMSARAILVNLKDIGMNVVDVIDSCSVEHELWPFTLIESPDVNAGFLQKKIIPEIKKAFKLCSGDKATVVIPDFYNIFYWLTLSDDAHTLSIELSDLVMSKIKPLLPHEIDKWLVSYCHYTESEKNNYIACAILKATFIGFMGAFKKNKLRVVSFQPATSALEDLVSRYSGSDGKKEQNISVVHIGEESTNVSIYKGGKLCLSRDLSVGEDRFIKSLRSQSPAKSPIDAKQAKKFLYEAVIFLQDNLAEQNEVRNYNLIRPIFGELIKECYDTHDAYLARFREFKINEILLCGPVSNMRNIETAIESHLNVTARHLSDICSGESGPISVISSRGVEIIPGFINEFAVLLGACCKNKWDYLGDSTTFRGKDPYAFDWNAAIDGLRKKAAGALKCLSPSPKAVVPKVVDNSGYVLEEDDGHRHICRAYSDSGTNFLRLHGGIEDETTGLTISQVKIDNIARLYTAKDITNLAKSGTDIKTKKN